MKILVYGQDKRVRDWVAERIGENLDDAEVAIGVEEDGELIAGVAYNMYTGAAICMNVAATPGKRWTTKEFMYAFFAYPFVQLKCRRVTGLVRVSNEVARKFDEHVGFIQEGVIRQAFEDGEDAILYGMLKSECRYLGVHHG
jgi:RimJ/RimL family protein N-acetyltransferase